VSEPAAIEATVRAAAAEEAPAVAAAVARLLAELGGGQPAREELEAEARAALAEPQAASLLVAEDSQGEIVGLLSASWLRAIHVPGAYGVIQDLWVEASWRSRGVGAQLVAAVAAEARERGAARLEVGLPRESFASIEATESFYRANGFEHLGPRMRRLL
jgi:GNAT superfamily N-acetyltransferase